ncbi:MAG: asparaginase [Blastocatellia bacterium]|nr:asparaginase [Blastocatellia bacterium]
MRAEILAEVTRGETVESIHRGHVMIVDGGGTPVAPLGDTQTVTFFRSACKSLQAIPCIASGAADAFDFSTEEIALAVASHSGEKQHVEIAARMLEKIGLSESDLRCGTHRPFNESESNRMLRDGETPSQLHNNCSGKHIAMLAFAKYIGADIRTYDSLQHPIQKAILECVSTFCEMPVGEIKIGIDGCSAPNFAVPVVAMAKSFVNLISPTNFSESVKDACSRIVSAMIAHPELIGGSTRLDTVIMKAAGGKVISKVGADGVWLCGILPCDEYPTGLGIALKIEDGDDHRARPVVAVEILRQLGTLAPNDLTEISPMALKSRRGDVVGWVRTHARF